MNPEQLMRVRKTTHLHLAMEVNETLQKIEDFPDNPRAMHYFYELFRRQYPPDGEELTPHRQKRIGTMCAQVPEELIYAAGATPVRLCSGANAFARLGANFMPTKSCPIIQATMGLLHLKQHDPDHLQAVVIPSTCDQKKKAADILDGMPYPVYRLEMPASKESELSRFFWQESVKHFTLWLEKLTGQKITAGRLKEAIARTGESRALFRRLSNLRQANPGLLLGKDLLLVSNAYFFDDQKQWQQAVQTLLAELETRRQQGCSAGQRHAPRLLLTGSPPIFPHLKIPLLVEETGGIIVADEVCSSSRLLHDAVAYNETSLNDMIPAVADRYLKPCTCPCLSPNTDRQRKLLELAKTHRVDGVVYQAFSGCLPYEMEQRQTAQTMDAAGIPMLYLETDFSPEDMGQLSTRVEAFLESIKSKKRKKAVAAAL